MLKSARLAFNLISTSVTLSMLAFFVTAFFLQNPQFFSSAPSMSGAYGYTAPSAPAPQGVAEEDAFIEARALEAGYGDQNLEFRSTWDTVSATLYRELGAYDIRFELTDDPGKNCGAALYGTTGGCYHSGGIYDQMIFISPEGISTEAARFIALHEYSHHLQDMEGGNRYSENIECDADLRAMELNGGWVTGFERQCLAAGYSLDQLTAANLPQLEAQS